MRQNSPYHLFRFTFPAALDLSIVIVSFNTRQILLECLKSLYTHTTGISFEIFVIDNSSIDGSAQAVAKHFPNVKIIQNSNNCGFSSAQNQGIVESRGEYVVLLNSDTLLIENCFLKIVSYLNKRQEFSICSPQILDENNCTGTMRLWEDSPRDAVLKILGKYNMEKEARKMRKIEHTEVEAIGGSCFVVRRKLFEMIGLLDENYFLYNEEDDFCRRARQVGQKVCYYPEASIRHLQGKSTHLPAFREKVIVESYKSNLYFYAKHYSTAWNLLFRILYRLTFFAAVMRSLWNRVLCKKSGSADDSISLHLKLLFMNPLIPTPQKHFRRR